MKQRFIVTPRFRHEQNAERRKTHAQEKTRNLFHSKCRKVLTRAIESLPRYLDDADAEEAAAIVADLLKSTLNSPVDAEQSLQDLIDEVADYEEDED